MEQRIVSKWPGKLGAVQSGRGERCFGEEKKKGKLMEGGRGTTKGSRDLVTFDAHLKPDRHISHSCPQSTFAPLPFFHDEASFKRGKKTFIHLSPSWRESRGADCYSNFTPFDLQRRKRMENFYSKSKNAHRLLQPEN